MVRSGGKDIVKKSSTRKGRYLLVFNFQLAPAAAGKLVGASRLGGQGVCQVETMCCGKE